MNGAKTSRTKYDLAVDILADLVARILPGRPGVGYRLPDDLWEQIDALLEQELLEWLDFEMTAKLLGTRDFVRIA
jgi:hypothetical protein